MSQAVPRLELERVIFEDLSTVSPASGRRGVGDHHAPPADADRNSASDMQAGDHGGPSVKWLNAQTDM